MANIAALWFVWVLVMFGGYGYAIANQLQRMKRMMTAPAASFQTVGNSFFSGMGKMFISAAIGFCGMVLLIIAIVVHFKAA